MTFNNQELSSMQYHMTLNNVNSNRKSSIMESNNPILIVLRVFVATVRYFTSVVKSESSLMGWLQLTT